MTLRPMLAALASAAAVFGAPAGAAALPDQIHVEYTGSVLVAVPVANITISAWLHEETYAGAANFRAGGLLRWFDDTDIVASTTGYRNNPGRALSPGATSTSITPAAPTALWALILPTAWLCRT